MRRISLLAACLFTALAAPAFAQTTLRIGLAEDPDILDPSIARTFVGRIVFTGLCDKLVDIDKDLKESGTKDMTAKFGARLVKRERCDYLRPTVILCDSPEPAIAKKEYMFPFTTVVQCPQEKMLELIGPTLVCSAITEDKKFQRDLVDAIHIDRLNIGPIPTIKLNWLQPHEGSIVDFLFRARAFQHTDQLKV